MRVRDSVVGGKLRLLRNLVENGFVPAHVHKLLQPLNNRLLDGQFHFGVPKLRLGLPLELHVLHLYCKNRAVVLFGG